MACSALLGSGNALGRFVALELTMDRGVPPEPLGDAYHFLTQEPQLLLDCQVLDVSGVREDPGRLRYWYDVRHGPRA
ncbi:MAG TPA: hypothetical protein VNY35_08785 [Solirubrobacteraceae bacterium]|nr:hypothetical protein [Solirubrobacteraceae bacterium]